IALGHVLHLLEDASVPDHTRDDTHADLFGDHGSPYEKFTREYTNSHRLTLAEDLKNTNFINFSNVQEAIKGLAIYSNNSFFSEDTLSNKDFLSPDLKNVEIKINHINDENILFLFDKQKQIYLAVLDNRTKNYSTSDKVFVLPSYRDHLFPKAVLTGASVINLFFKDVEYYKQHPDQLEPIVPDVKEPLATAIKNSPKRIAIKIADKASRFGADVSKAVANTKIAVNSLLGPLGFQIASNNNANTQPNSELTSQPENQNPLPAPTTAPPTIATAPTPKPPVPAPTPVQPSVIVEPALPAPSPPVVEPPAPPITPVVPPPQPKPSYILAVGYNPPPPAPEPEPAPAPSTPTSTLEIATTTISSTSTESAATSTVSVTTTIETPTTTISTTTPEIATSTISVTTSTDTATTTTSTPAIEPASPEVVINEVAWAGTASNFSNDEWFELYNNTDQDIDLTGWKILASGAQVNLTKINNKIISAHGYYLLERKEDFVIRDMTADVIYTLSGGFNNKGEKLELFKSNGAKVDEVDASDGWFAGDNTKYRSMERLDPAKNGSDPANWQSNQGYRMTGLNANWGHVYGSPRQPNFGYVVLEQSQEEDVKTLDIKNSPYVVQYYVVPAGKTLNINPGVSVLLPVNGVLEINGSLNALGESDKRISFLPYVSSSKWGTLKFSNSTSTLSFVNLKHGNSIPRLPQNQNGMIWANNSNLTINNTLLWDSETNAIGGTDSALNISNSTIGADTKNQNLFGINTRGGALNLDNVSFINLSVGVEAGC
ncbi:MAG: lamin tail domain-containing protein, partial [Patescibacteria group bacterium]